MSRHASVTEEVDRRSTPGSDPISDLFEDEERVGGLLKSLINPQGLNNAWQRVAKRLQVVEAGLKSAQAVLARLPEDYVSQKDFQETVRERHTQLLEAHDARLQKLEELSERLSFTVFEDHGPRLRKCIEDVDVTRSSQAGVEAKTNEMQRSTQSLQEKVVGDLKTLTEFSTKFQADSLAAAKALEARVDDQIEGLVKQIKQGQEHLQEHIKEEIRRSHEELTKVEENENGPSDHQAKMLEFVSKHLADPLHRVIQGVRDEHEELKQEVGKQKEDFTREIRGAQKTAVDAGIRMKQVAQELKADMELRPKKDVVQKMEGVFSTNINAVNSSMSSLQSKVSMKLNEFVDHFGKLHETIDDHEHCLRHHSEELENRSSKYELLTCQHQIDRCALKDDFLRESAEVRKLLNWQTSKIEGFSLLGSHKKRVKIVSRKPQRHRINVRGSAGPSGKNTPGSPDDDDDSSQGGGLMMSRVASTASMDDSILAKKRGTVGSIAESDIPVSTTLSRDRSSLASLRRKSTATLSDHEQEDHHSDDEELLSTDGSESSPGSSQMRQQLECVSMGLVSLAHLALREVRLGTSRNAKLLMEKELLEELLNLRHWISSRMAPSGWDHSKLTTLALRCSHPREDEIQIPRPQLPLKDVIVHASEDFHAERKRFLSADPPPERAASFGAKTAPLLARPPLSARSVVQAAALVVEPSLSARTLPSAPVSGTVLPPLQTVAAA